MESDFRGDSINCESKSSRSDSCDSCTDEQNSDSDEPSQTCSESSFVFVDVSKSNKPLSSSNDEYERIITKEKDASANHSTDNIESDSETDETTNSEVNSSQEDENDNGMAVDPLNIDFIDQEYQTRNPSPKPSRRKPNLQLKEERILKKDFVCDYPGCNAKFSRPWKLSAHHCRHTGERPFMCSRVGCTKSYTNPTHLRRHDLKVHEGLGDIAKNCMQSFKCKHPNCWLGPNHPGFYTLPGLKKHEIKHEIVDKNGLVCSDCDMRFTRLNDLKTHRYQHDNVLPFKCEYCGREFLRYMEYKKHLRGHKKFRCDAPGCEALEFVTFKDLRQHKVIHNTDIRCELCQKTFPMQCRLRVHLEEVHLKKNTGNIGQWRCTVEGCDRIFTLRRNMMQHVKQKHEGTGYECPFEGCKLKFVWKQSLNKHMPQHFLNAKSPPKLKPKAKRKEVKVKRRTKGVPKRPTTAEILSDVVVNSATKQQLLKKDEFDTDEEVIETFQHESDGNSDTDRSLSKHTEKQSLESTANPIPEPKPQIKEREAKMGRKTTGILLGPATAKIPSDVSATKEKLLSKESIATSQLESGRVRDADVS